MVASVALGAVRPADVALSPDGSRIYVAGKDGNVRVYLAETGALLHTWDIGTTLGGIDLSPDGSFLVVAETVPVAAQTVTSYKVDTATGQFTSYPLNVVGTNYGIYDVAVQSDGTVLLTQSITPGWSGWASLLSLNLATGQYTTLPYSIRHSSPMSPSEDGTSVLLTENDISDAPLRMIESSSIVANHDWYEDNVSGFNEGVQAYSDAAGLVAQHLEGMGVLIYDDDFNLLINLASVSGRWSQSAASGLAFDAAGDNLYILDNVSDTIVQFSTATWTIVQEIPVGVSFTSDNNYYEGNYGNRLLVGPNARYFTVVTTNGLQLVVNPYVSATISGTDESETVYGTGLNDVLEAQDGDDILIGGVGDDEMVGGDGNDVYMVDDEGDTVVELAGEGVDEVRTAIGSKAAPDYALYVLPDFVENLTGTSSGAQGVRGNVLDNVVTMGVGNDLIVLDDGGVDNVDAGAGNDYIYYGATLTGADTTNGGAGTDTVGLLGNYTGGSAITFTAANLVGVERLALYTGSGTNSYSVTMNDSNVAAGTEFFVTAASLNSAETLFFNGSAETNGRFTLLGGSGSDLLVGGLNGDYVAGNAGDDVLYGIAGDDFILGGLGADELNGGGGHDSFRYSSTAESTAGSVDQIIDFTDLDRIDLSRIDANGNLGDGDTAFTFIGAGAFTNVAGQLRATESGGVWTVEGDVNGDGLADLIIEVNLVSPMVLGASDFNL